MTKKPGAIFIALLSTLTFATTAYIVEASEAPTSSTKSLIAEVTKRVEPDKLKVLVYYRGKLVQLPHFKELLAVTPLVGARRTIENLVGKSVAVVSSAKKPDQWEVYILPSAASLSHNYGRQLEVSYNPAQQRRTRSGNTSQETLTGQMLADNVFVVKQVFISSQRSPVELKLDGQVIRLKQGDALLVL